MQFEQYKWEGFRFLIDKFPIRWANKVLGSCTWDELFSFPASQEFTWLFTMLIKTTPASDEPVKEGSIRFNVLSAPYIDKKRKIMHIVYH